MVSRKILFPIIAVIFNTGCGGGGQETTAPQENYPYVLAASVLEMGSDSTYHSYHMWVVGGVPVRTFPRVWIGGIPMPSSSMQWNEDAFLVGYSEDYPTLFPGQEVHFSIRVPCCPGDTVQDSAAARMLPIPRVSLRDSEGLWVMWEGHPDVREYFAGIRVHCRDTTGTHYADTALMIEDTSVYLPLGWMCPVDTFIYASVEVDVAFIGGPWKGEGGNFGLLSGRYIPISHTSLEFIYPDSLSSPAVFTGEEARAILERVFREMGWR